MHVTSLAPTEALQIDPATEQLHTPPSFFKGNTLGDYCRLGYYAGTVIAGAVVDTVGKIAKEFAGDDEPSAPALKKEFAGDDEPSAPALKKEELPLFHDYPNNMLLRYPIRALNALRWKAYVMSTLTPKPGDEDARLSRTEYEASISRNWPQLARGIGQSTVRLAKETPLVVESFKECARDSKKLIVEKIKEIREKRRLSKQAPAEPL